MVQMKDIFKIYKNNSCMDWVGYIYLFDIKNLDFLKLSKNEKNFFALDIRIYVKYGKNYASNKRSIQNLSE